MNQDEMINRIFEGLKQPGKSQVGLARHLGCSEATISKLVNRQRDLSIREVKAIEAYLGMPITERKSVTGDVSLSQLGRQTPLPLSPQEAQLERVPNPHADTRYVARFTQPEFTSLCPVTGQPDFAHIVIDYVPDKWLVESKSLKLYLAAFRNHGAFHEDCTVAIGKRVADLLKPHYLRIGGYWYPRGGMPIDVFWQAGKLPDGVWMPDQGVAPYRGRG